MMATVSKSGTHQANKEKLRNLRKTFQQKNFARYKIEAKFFNSISALQFCAARYTVTQLSKKTCQ